MKLSFQTCYCHLSLFRRESVTSVSYSWLPQSQGQSTKQDTLPCSRVRSKSKENISLQSFPFQKKQYFYYFKSGTSEFKFKNSEFCCKKRSVTILFNAPYGRKRKFLQISDQEIVSCSFRFLVSDFLSDFFTEPNELSCLLSQEMLACIFCFLRLSVSSLKQLGL